jgi:STE24 endopeptidase
MKWLRSIALTLILVASNAGHCHADSDVAPANVVSADAENIAPVAVPEPSAQAVRHYRSGNLLWMVSTVWAFAVPALIFFSGFSARLRSLAQRVNRHWYFSLLVYLVLSICVLFLADLPLDFYSDYIRPHDYGLSAQAFGKWFKDEFLSLALGIVGAALIAWIPLLLVKRSAKRWWLYAWFAGIPIIVFMSLIEPIWIEPLFNQFGPMQDKALEARILQLAARAGVDTNEVFQVNKSVDTNELNAYVTGIGGTKRIVLWDTTLKELTTKQVEQVMSHEMGHYALRHVWKGLAGAIVLLLVGLWFVHVSAEWLLPRFSRYSDVREIGDIAALPLLALLLSAAAFLLTPPMLAVSRHFEREADRFGLELTHDNHTCATVFVKFVQHDLAYPRPSALMQWFRASHPSIAERIDFCNSYHPWLEGREGRYSSYLK